MINISLNQIISVIVKLFSTDINLKKVWNLMDLRNGISGN